MFQKSKWTFFFVFVLFGLGAQAQMEELGRIDYSASPYVHLKKVGDKIVFFNFTYKKVWVTDGTKSGTKRLDIHPEKNIFFQSISADSLLMMHSTNNEKSLKVFLFTALMSEPTEIATIPNFYYRYLVHNVIGHQLVMTDKVNFVFLDFATGSYTKKNYSQVATSGVRWVNANSKFYFWEGSKFYHVDLSTYELTSIFEFPESIATIHLLNDSDEFVIFLKKEIWYSDGTTGNTVLGKQFSQYIKNYFFEQLVDKSFFTILYRETGTSNVDSTVLFVTDGTDTGTFPIKTIDYEWAPSYNSNRLFFKKLENKIFFIANETLYQTDGTKQGTNELQNPLNIKFAYFAKGGENGTLVMERKNGLSTFFYLHSTGDVLPIEGEKHSQSRYHNDPHYYTKYGEEAIFMPLVDIDYGLEMHRFHLTSHKTERITDAKKGNNWGQFNSLGFIGNKFLFAQKKPDGEMYLMAFNINTEIQAEAPIKKNYEWAELVPHTVTHVNNIYGIDIATDGSCQFSFFRTSTPSLSPDTRNNSVLKYQRKTIPDSLFRNKLVRLDKDGTMIFSKSFPKSFDQDVVGHCFDKQDNSVVAVRLSDPKTTIDGNQFLKSNGELLLQKISPHGKLLWATQAKIGINGMVEQIRVDSDDNIIVAGAFSGLSVKFGTIPLVSDRNPTAFMAKYSKDGVLLWATSHPLPTIWPVFNSPFKFTIDKNDNIYFYQRMNKNVQKSDCLYRKHRIRITAISGLQGQTIWQKEFVGDDFCFVADIDASPLGKIFVLGGYNGNIQFDYAKMSSDSCNQNNRFLLELNAKDGHVEQVKKLNHANEFCQELTFDRGGNYYLSGTKEEKQYFGINAVWDQWYFDEWNHSILYIEKYNPLGQLINQKRLRQNSNYHQVEYKIDHDFNPKLAMGHNGDVLVGCNIISYLDSFNISYGVYGPAVFLLKFNMGADSIIHSDGALANADVLISPNPVDDVLFIRSNDIDFTQANIIIYSMDGKQWKVPIEKNHGQVTVNTDLLPKGVYAVVIYLGDQVLAQKIMKT